MIARHLTTARQELASKTEAQIDAEAAAVWGARAVAAFEAYRRSGHLGWFARAVNAKHEALEHAGGGPPGTSEAIQEELHTLTGGAL